MNIIAITADSEIFRNERLLDVEFMKKFPGMSWVPILAKRMSQFKFTTTDVAINHVNNGFWKIREIGVIQHLSDPDAEKLISLGAKPLVLIAHESPVYATNFFNNIKHIAAKFPKTILLEILYQKLPLNTNKNFILRFPSFFSDDIQPIVPWKDRSYMVMVVRNMYNDNLSINYLKHPLDIPRYIFRLIKIKIIKRNIQKPTFNLKILHNSRIEAILFFGKRNELDLYGYGWENLKNLPRIYQKNLSPLLNKMKPKPINDKIGKMRNYKFAICFENGAYLGGISEKIIDCFVAGVIPVYLGATNIEEYIPTGSFIDVRSFNTWEELSMKLISINEQEANQIIQEGRKFLKSHFGQMYSYEGFASFMQDRITEIT